MFKDGNSKFVSNGQRYNFTSFGSNIRGSFIEACSNSSNYNLASKDDLSCLQKSSKDKFEQIYDDFVANANFPAINSASQNEYTVEVCFYPSNGIILNTKTSDMSREPLTEEFKKLISPGYDKIVQGTNYYTDTEVCLNDIIENPCFKHAEDLAFIFEYRNLDEKKDYSDFQFKINDVQMKPLLVVQNTTFHFKHPSLQGTSKFNFTVCSSNPKLSATKQLILSVSEKNNIFYTQESELTRFPYKPIIKYSLIATATDLPYITFDVPSQIGTLTDTYLFVTYENEFKTKNKAKLSLVNVRSSADVSNKGANCKKYSADEKYLIDKVILTEVNKIRVIYVFFSNLPTSSKLPFASVKLYDSSYDYDLVNSDIFIS